MLKEYEYLSVSNMHLLKTSSRFFLDGVTYSFSRLVDALQAYDAHVIETKGNMAHHSELNRPDEILGHRLDQTRTNQEFINDTEDYSKDYSLDYFGVSFHRQTKMYEAYIYYQKGSGGIGTKRSVGSYMLASDAALARDICSLELGISSPSNFPQETDYNEARTKELEERGVEVAKMEVDKYLTSKVQKVISTVAEEGVQEEPTEDDSEEEPEFSHDFDVEQRYAFSKIVLLVS